MADGRAGLCHHVLHHCVRCAVAAFAHHHPPAPEACAAVRVAPSADLLYRHSHFLYVPNAVSALGFSEPDPSLSIAALFMFLAVCIFGGCAYRRDWLMYPKFNVLGWSYALAVVTFMLLGLAALILQRESRQAYEARGEQKNLVMQMEMQEPGYQPPRHHHSQSRSLQGYI